jgi:hypothetical protein
MVGTILKGIGVIKGVSPKVKSKGVSKSKGNISKNVGQAKKVNFKNEREVIRRKFKKC